jgi:excisionase family DNA binding protein
MGDPKPRLLDVHEAAARLGTSHWFPRRLIKERRIRYTKIGHLVRIPEDALDELIAAGTVDPEPLPDHRRVA